MAKSISRYLADATSTTGALDGLLSIAAQTNITSLGTLSSLTVSGSAAMTLTTAAQPNITSVGTLTALTGGTGDLIWDTNTLVVDSSANNVGIGTTSPSSNLHVKGTAETQVYIDAATNNNSGVRFLENGTNKWTIGNDNTNDGFFFYDFGSSATRLTIDSSGNVGIGTASPGSYTGIQSNLEVKNASHGGVAINAGTNSLGMLAFAQNGTHKWSVEMENSATPHLSFNEAGTQRMTIDAGGNVGIGTTNPGYKLDVRTGNNWGVVHSDGTRKVATYIDASGGNDGLYTINSMPLVLGAGGAAKLWIHTDGKVGIGTANSAAGLMVETTTDGTGLSGDDTNVAYFHNQEATAGHSYGVRIKAGSNATDYAFRVDTLAANSVFEVDGAGEVMVGTASSGGSISNTNPVTAGAFRTMAGAASAADNTATTLVTLPAGFATYIVNAGFNGINNAGAYGATAIVHTDGSTNSITQLVNPSNMTISMSGMAVQGTHTGQGATLNISFSVLRM
jgi:hypothetical protein